MDEEITEQLNIVFDGIAAEAPIATTVSQLIAVGAPLSAVMAAMLEMCLGDQPHELTAELRTAIAAVETAIRDADDEYARLVGTMMSLMLAPNDLDATVAEGSQLRAGFVCQLWSDTARRRRLLAAADPEFVAAVRWACRRAGSDWPDPADRMWCRLLETSHAAVQSVPDVVLAAMVRHVMLSRAIERRAMLRRAMADADLGLHVPHNVPHNVSHNVSHNVIADIAQALAGNRRPVFVLPPVII